MKNLLTLLLPFLATASFSQSILQTRQVEFAGELFALEQTPGGNWLIGGATGDPKLSFSNGYFAEFNTAGDLLREEKFNFLERTAVTAFLPLPDGRLVVGGYSEGCDFGYSGFVALYDATGARKWLAIQDQATGSPRVTYISGLFSMVDGNILAVGSTLAQVFDLETGKELKRADLPGYNHQAARSSNGSYYFLLGSTGLYLLRSDLSLKTIAPLNGAQWPEFLAGTATGADGRFFARLAGNTIVAADTTGVLHTVSLDFPVACLAPDGPDLLLTGRKSSLGRVERRDSNLNLVYGFDLADPDLIPARIRPDGPNTMLAGMELHGVPPRAYADQNSGSASCNLWLQSFPPPGSTGTAPGTDAALTELLVNMAPTVGSHNDPPFTVWTVSGGDYSVRLQNTGSETLNEVSVVAAGYGHEIIFICPEDSYFHQDFTNLNLAPGASMLLHLGGISTQYAEPIQPWKLCFWVATPNGLTDLNHDNDYVCHEMNLVSAAQEPLESTLRLFPNPASETLNVQGADPGRCRVFSSTGQVVGEINPKQEQGIYQLNIKHLPAGLYWLQPEQGPALKFVRE